MFRSRAARKLLKTLPDSDSAWTRARQASGVYWPACHCYSTARPSIAPKPVLDLKSIIKSPGLYEQNCLDRNYKAQARNSWKILELSQNRANLIHAARGQREENNAIQAQIGQLQGKAKDNGEPQTREDSATSLKNLFRRAKTLKDDLARFSEEEKQIEDEMLQLALALPNLSSHHTPNGNDYEVLEIVEPAEKSLKYHTNPADQCLNSSSTSHVDIGAQMDLLDFAGAAKASGWGWYYLKNEVALLEQALIQFALSVLRKKGFTIVSPPSIVYSHIAAACGFQPRDQHDEQQIYTLQQAEKDANKPLLSLAATAEIPLAGMFAGHTFGEKELPLRAGAVSRCYRAEAGARGVDTKGLYRVHEFTKVEMFAWTLPPSSAERDGYFDVDDEPADVDVFAEMVEIQKEILGALGLTYRVLEMPASDLGGPATRKQDIEAFFPSRRDKDEGWGEVTSTSICTDYQSRRLATKVKMADGHATWPYTFNGTALAVPRILAAIMETHYDPTRQSIAIPYVLRKWMDIDEIKR